MAITTTITMDKAFSIGSKRMAVGTITMTGDGVAAWTTGGEVVVSDGTSLSSEAALKRFLGFNNEVEYIFVELMTNAAATQAFSAKLAITSGKLILHGSSAIVGELDEAATPDAEAYTGNYMAIGV